MTVLEAFSNAPEAQASDWVDLADLTSLVASLTGPDRTVDLVLDAMLGGTIVLERLTREDIRNMRWLASESPAYTAGGGPLRVLLQRRGYRAATIQSGSAYQTTVTSSSTGSSKSASGHTEAVSTLLALLLSLSSKES